MRLVDCGSTVEHGAKRILERFEAETGLDRHCVRIIELYPIFFVFHAALHAQLFVSSGFVNGFVFGCVMFAPQPKRILEQIVA
jgi:hypothetical protein